MSEIEPQEDRPLDADEQARAAKLTDSDLRVIDECILSHVTHRYQKTARMVALTMMELRDRFPVLPDVFYSGRIKLLAGRGVIESVGNLNRMRFSEVRLPGNSSESDD